MALDKKRMRMCDKMFDTYDTNASESLDIEEFCQIMQKYDPTIDPEGIQTTFKAATGEDTNMTREQFYAWVGMLFGDSTDAEFIAGVDELVRAKDKKLPQGVIPMKIDRTVRVEMDRKTSERQIIGQYEAESRRLALMVCKNCGGQATQFCSDCGKVSYCEACSALVHSMAMFQGHQPGNICDIEADVRPPIKIATTADRRDNVLAIDPWAHGIVEEVSLEDQFALAEHRLRPAHKLFLAYDADNSGFIDLAEFTVLCQMYDPRLLPGEVSASFKSVGVFDGKMDPKHFNMWLSMTFGEADDEEFTEAMADLIESVSPAALAGEQMSDRLKDLSIKLFAAYDKDDSGFLDFNEFFFMLRCYDRNCPPEAAKNSFKNAGCSGEMMSVKQFKSWVAIVFGQAPADEAEESLGQLLLASGVEYGTGADDPEMRARRAMEVAMMGEHRKQVEFGAGKLNDGARQIFRDPTVDRVRGGLPIPEPVPEPKEGRPTKAVVNLTRAERVKLEMDAVADMRRKKEVADGGVEAVKVLVEDEKRKSRAQEQECLKLGVRTRDAKNREAEAEKKLLQYMKDTEAEVKLYRWLVEGVTKESHALILNCPQTLSALALKCFDIGKQAGTNNPALAGTGSQLAPGSSGSKTPRVVAAGDAKTRRQTEKALMAELQAGARAQGPEAQVLGELAQFQVQQLEASPILHKIQMDTEKEVLDWKKWCEVKDLMAMTPAAQAAMKHQRSSRALSTAEENAKAIADAAQAARPEFMAKTKLKRWVASLAGAKPVHYKAPTGPKPQLPVASPPRVPPASTAPSSLAATSYAGSPASPFSPAPFNSSFSPPPSGSPTMRLGAVDPTMSMRMGAVSPNLSMTPSPMTSPPMAMTNPSSPPMASPPMNLSPVTFGQNMGMTPSMTPSMGMTPSMTPSMNMTPSPAMSFSSRPPADAGAAPMTPQQQQRQVRQLGFTLTLREVEMAVRVCKSAMIRSDTEEFSLRLHEMLARSAGGADGMAPSLLAPSKNTEPIRTFARIKLARTCSQGMPHVYGSTGDRKEWTPAMFDQAMQLLPQIEQEVTRLIIDSRITQ